MKTNEEIVKEWLAEEATDNYVWGELDAKTLDGCLFDFEELIKRLDKECEDRVREERERIQEIVAKWMESSNPAYAQDLFKALTPTKTDKQTEV